jgi:hypothetical protein
MNVLCKFAYSSFKAVTRVQITLGTPIKSEETFLFFYLFGSAQRDASPVSLKRVAAERECTLLELGL